MATAKERLQVIVDAKQAEVTELQGIGTQYEEEQKTAVAAAESAILESVGQLNGEGKLYSDKEWNDNEDAHKLVEEALRTQIADLGAQVDGASGVLSTAQERAEKAEAKLAKAKAAYEAQQTSESESEAVGKIFAEDEEESVPSSGDDVSQTPQS